MLSLVKVPGTGQLRKTKNFSTIPAAVQPQTGNTQAQHSHVHSRLTGASRLPLSQGVLASRGSQHFCVETQVVREELPTSE